MKKDSNQPLSIDSISVQHQLLGLPGPQHPLVSLINFEDVKAKPLEAGIKFSTAFYTVALKNGCKCKVRYGQHYYDYDQGVLSFIGPNQVMSWEANDSYPTAGWLLIIHPDFIRNHPLGQKMKEYHFFDYAVNEALHLSQEEEETIAMIMKSIQRESAARIDHYSQDVIIAQIEVLLSYSNRFYNRQFITRKTASSDLLTKLDALLTTYFSDNKEMALPTVHQIAVQLNMSSSYLSDTLRSLTGQSAQQHIHNKLIDHAKGLLATTSFSVSEIAYQLGFAYPQSFSKLFKSKTELSPLEFRESFN